MNRQVVQYSALGCVAVAALGGIIYFAFLGGTKADDPPAAAQSESSAETPRAQAATGRPDPLFAAPVQMGKSERQPVSDPFHRRPSQVVATAYGDDEPRRFEPDPTASPLMPASDRHQRASAAENRLVAGGASAADDQDAATSAQPPDPFGLRSRGTNGSAADGAAPRKSSGAARNGNKSSTAKKASPSKNGVGSRYADSLAEDEASLRLIEPAPLAGAAGDDPAGASADAADDTSLFDRGRGHSSRTTAASSKNKSATKNAMTLRQSQSNDAEPSTAPPQGRYGSPVDNSQVHDGDHFTQDDQDRQPHPSQVGANDALRPFEDDGVGPIGAGGSQRRPDLSAGAFGDRHSATGNLLEQQSRGNAFSTPSGPGGSGRPGSRQVEGKQSPQITIHKIAPDELQVGRAATIELNVRNTGTVVAQNVEIRDVVPENTQFVAANPPATPNVQGELIWPVGALKPGDVTTIEVELMPVAEGEVGSVAVVTFQAEAGARSRVTKPDLTLQVTSAKQVMIGQEVLLSIKIANPGSGLANGVVIEERVPSGLKHPAGNELEFEVGTLKPGETRELDLALTAAQAGRIINQIAARGEAGIHAEAQCELEVIAPALAISMEGPSRRYLERQATYTVSVSNPGTAPAKDVELVTRLPKGLKFVKANNAGHYDPQSHTVVWSLEELPPAETGTVTLTAIPVELGEQRLRAEGRAKQNLADEKEQTTIVEGLAALLFEVVDVADPIEIKGQTEYEIRITNQGSKSADHVRLVAQLPPELKFVSADGPTRFVAEGDRVIFEPLARLSPKADITYRVAVQGEQPGDLRMRFQLTTADMPQPVTKEESTRVYSDE
jgi:uncharacterized repeat protein (TIGR01451 family)